MKNIIAASILLSLFVFMVFSFPYIQYWAQSYEASHTAQVLFWTGLGLLIVGLSCWRENMIIKHSETEQHKQDVADMVHAHKNKITMPEMRENAESLLSDDEKAMMQMMKLHPEYRRTGEYTPQMFGAKIDTKV